MYEIRDDLPLLEETLRSQYEGNSETVEQLIADVNELCRCMTAASNLIRDGSRKKQRRSCTRLPIRSIFAQTAMCARSQIIQGQRSIITWSGPTN